MMTISDTYQTTRFTVISISFLKADTQTRGRFTFFDEQIEAFMSQIHEREIGDAFILSTCNRTEIYTTAHNYMLVAQLFCEVTGTDLIEFMQYMQVKKDKSALEHLFRVAAGLESQIIGDFEIISQIKNAYNNFKVHKQKANPYLERAVNSSLQISKRVKNETSLSNGAASVSYAAVHYILETQKHLSEKNILLLGVGKIGQNTVENLIKHIEKPSIKISNRSFDRAEKIAEKYNIPHIEYHGFEKELQNTDILIVATASQTPILHVENIPDHPMLIIDLSVPHNVDPAVGNLSHVELIDIDQLSSKIEKTVEERIHEIPKAESIITEMSKEFEEWENTRKLVPHIHRFKQTLEQMEQNEVLKTTKKFGKVEEEDKVLTQRMIQKITNRFAKYIIENPERSQEIANLMDEMLNLQSDKKSNEIY